jgi:hypothetical protein
MPVPPGTIKVNVNLYLDDALIRVEDYREFVDYMKINKGILGIENNKCQLDSGIFYQGKSYLESNRYKSDFPILNLNDYQIESYCKWRSYIVSMLKNNPDRKTCNNKYWHEFDLKDPLQQYKVEYFLPDSITINLYKPKKQINIPEKHQIKNGSATNYVKKHFGKSEVVGFRCAARYVQVKSEH